VPKPLGPLPLLGLLHLRSAAWRVSSGTARTLAFRLGAIAQLGERLDRTQEVAGSSPASSTLTNRMMMGFWRRLTRLC
jgi:hypothetical protein